MMPRELTLELTDYCPFDCSFCSSNTTDELTRARYLDFALAKRLIAKTEADIIHLSGGEPMAHPFFFTILRLCQEAVGRRNVRVQTNMLEWIACNLHVCPGVRVEGQITPDVDDIRVLKRVRQGRERAEPVVRFSRNWAGECAGDCGHLVVRPDGTTASAPCRKEEK